MFTFLWQITDGKSRCWGICDERFWLQRWKFVNSKVQLRLQLQSKVNPLVMTGFLWWGHHRWMKTHSNSRHVSYFKISTVSPCLPHLRIHFWGGDPRRRWTLLMCHQKSDRPWKVWCIPLCRAVAEACWGYWCVGIHLKCDLPHLRLSTVARYLATVTKGIVWFHSSATSTLLWLSTHKSVKIEISRLRLSEVAATFNSLREMPLSSTAQPSSRRKMH